MTARFDRPIATADRAQNLTDTKDTLVLVAKQLDDSTPTGIASGMVRWSSTNSKWQKYNGTSWVDLAATFAMNVSSLGGQVAANYLLKSGGTLTGALVLSGAPTVDLHAATKKYVDDKTESISFRAQASNITSAGLVTAWTEKEDIGDCFSGGYFTPPKDGTYLFTADAIIGSNTVSGVWQMLISDDGGAFITQASGFVSVSSSTPTSGGSLSCSSVVRLTAGNKVKLSFPTLPATPKIAYVYFSGAWLHK